MLPKMNHFLESEPTNFQESFKNAFDYFINTTQNFTSQNFGQSSELVCAGIMIVNNMINTTFEKGKILTTFDLSHYMISEKMYEYCDGINFQMFQFKPESVRISPKKAKKIDEELKEHEKIERYHPLYELFNNDEWHVHNKSLDGSLYVPYKYYEAGPSGNALQHGKEEEEKAKEEEDKNKPIPYDFMHFMSPFVHAFSAHYAYRRYCEDRHPEHDPMRCAMIYTW